MNKNHGIKMIIFACTVCSTSFLSINSAIAKEYYKWVDSKGSTHYTSQPPPKNAKKKGKVSTYGWRNDSTTITQMPSAPVQNQTTNEIPNPSANVPTSLSRPEGPPLNMDQQQREANAALENSRIEHPASR